MYKTCRQLPLYNFQEITETGDLKYLLEDPKEAYQDGELLEVYKAILDEYNKLIGNHENIEKHKVKAEVYYCNNKLNNLNKLKWLLNMDFEFDEDVLVDIKKQCIFYNTEFTNEKLDWSIAGITNRLKRKQKELGEEHTDNDQSFDEFFIEVCKSYGQKVNKKETSLSEWCAIIKSVMKK